MPRRFESYLPSVINSKNIPTHGFWGGSFAKGKFEDKFKIISIVKDKMFEQVEVTVVFYASPDKEYVFVIDENTYESGKANIAAEILRQLKEKG